MITILLQRRTVFMSFVWLGPMLLFLSTAAHAAMMISTDDQEFHGEMIAATINTVTIDDDDGGYTIVPRTEVLAVQIDIRGGDVLTGVFHDWRDGVCILQVEDRLIGVQDGLVTFIMSAAPDPALPSGRPKTADRDRTQGEPSSEQPSPLEGVGPAHRIQM